MKVCLLVVAAVVAAASLLSARPACALAAAPPPVVEPPAGERFTVTATIRRIEVEGVFFGIVSDDGRRFDPRNLPKEFAVDGLRVKVSGVTEPDRMSSHMWGIVVRVDAVEKLAP